MKTVEKRYMEQDVDIHKDGYRISSLDTEGNPVHTCWVPFNPYRDMPEDYEPSALWAMVVIAEYWQKRAEAAEMSIP